MRYPIAPEELVEHFVRVAQNSSAPAGNRTRITTLEELHSTTKLQALEGQLP